MDNETKRHLLDCFQHPLMPKTFDPAKKFCESIFPDYFLHSYCQMPAMKSTPDQKVKDMHKKLQTEARQIQQSNDESTERPVVISRFKAMRMQMERDST